VQLCFQQQHCLSSCPTFPDFTGFYWRLIRSPDCSKYFEHAYEASTVTPSSARPHVDRIWRPGSAFNPPSFLSATENSNLGKEVIVRNSALSVSFHIPSSFSATAALNLVAKLFSYFVPRGVGPLILLSTSTIVRSQQASRTVRSSGRRDTWRLWR
jgi:hypothetical protein